METIFHINMQKNNPWAYFSWLWFFFSVSQITNEQRVIYRDIFTLREAERLKCSYIYSSLLVIAIGTLFWGF